jgi:hypothetical protein
VEAENDALPIDFTTSDGTNNMELNFDSMTNLGSMENVFGSMQDVFESGGLALDSDWLSATEDLTLVGR